MIYVFQGESFIFLPLREMHSEEGDFFFFFTIDHKNGNIRLRELFLFIVEKTDKQHIFSQKRKRCTIKE